MTHCRRDGLNGKAGSHLMAPSPVVDAKGSTGGTCNGSIGMIMFLQSFYVYNARLTKTSCMQPLQIRGCNNAYRFVRTTACTGGYRRARRIKRCFSAMQGTQNLHKQLEAPVILAQMLHANVYYAGNRFHAKRARYAVLVV